jgi:Zn-dependent peptidase ImmA (M78 family)
MQYSPNQLTHGRSVLASLRALLPNRRLQFSEALRIAELQANRLLELAGVDAGPVPVEVITQLPRIAVDYEIDMPCSGASDWDNERKTWVITLNALEPDTRHRFSIAHEYWHIVTHGSPGLVDLGSFTFMGREPVEAVAEYFAACLLMPKRLVKRAWGEGHQRVSELSDLFEVSPRAMKIRLEQLGLVDRALRCDSRPRTSGGAFRRRYRRALSANWSPPTVREVAA